MSLVEQHRQTRRERTHSATRESILDAARRVAERDGARNLSLRSVAGEAGFAPAALYGYFRNKDELLVALAADDLSGLARSVREVTAHDGRLGAAAQVAWDILKNTETFAAATSALPATAGSSESERLFNGRLIAALKALSEAAGETATTREAQADVVLLAATLSGLALLSRAGRLEALGFGNAELIARLDKHFGPGS
jgi:AcrR family transcriptional regulator